MKKTASILIVVLVLSSFCYFGVNIVPMAWASYFYTLEDSDTDTTNMGALTVRDEHPSDDPTYASSAGQALTTGGTGYTLGYVQFYIHKIGSPTSDLVCAVYSVTGTVGTDAEPTGSALVYSTIFDSSLLTGGDQWITFNFTTENYDLSASTDYAFSLEVNTTNVDASNYVQMEYDINAGHGGNLFYFKNGAYTVNVADTLFKLYSLDEPTNQVELKSPSHTGTETAWSVDFVFKATFYQTIQNASLHIENTTSVPTEILWTTHHWNTSSVENKTDETISYSFSGNGEGSYKWNIEVFNSTHGVFAPSNRTLTVDIPPRYQNVDSNSSSIEEDGTILLYGQVLDGIGVDYAVLATNETGAWKNYTESTASGYGESFDKISSWEYPDGGWAQGIATNETHVWVTNNFDLFLYFKNGTQVTNNTDAHLEGTDMDQVNGLELYGNYVYVSSQKDADPDQSYIKVFHQDNLSYVEEHQVYDDLSEDVTFKDNYWWVTFILINYVYRYNTNWEYVDNHELTFTGTNNYYQSGKFIGNYFYANQHEDSVDPDYCDIYYWNGTGFDEIDRVPVGDRPDLYCTQGLYPDPDNVTMWWSGRNGATNRWAINSTINYNATDPTYYDSPMDMNDIADTWTWGNFTWQNTSIPTGTTIQWEIFYNDTYGNVNGTGIHSFTIDEDGDGDTLFYDGFETGDLSLWDLGGDYPYPDHEVQSTIKYNGTYASWMNGTASDHHRCEKNVTLTTETVIHLQFWVRIDQAPTGPANGFIYLAGLGDTTPTSEVMLCLNTTSMNFGLMTEHIVTSYTESSMTASLQTWYQIDIYVMVEDSVYLFVDGNQEVSRGDAQSLSEISNVMMIYQIGKGLGWSGNHTVYHDDVLLDNVLFETPVGPVGPFGPKDHRLEINVRLNGERLRWANVSVEGGPDNKLKWGLTDVYGKYIFKLKTGSYELVATFEEYRQTKSLYVSRHMTVSIDFTKEDIIGPEWIPEDAKDFLEELVAWIKLPELDLTTETMLVFILPLIVLVIYAVKKASEGPKRKWKYSYLK